MWRRVARGLVLSFSTAFLLLPALYAQNFIGFIESPPASGTVSGLVLVKGWAIDEQQISRVDLYVDNQFQGRASLNLPRIDVIHAYPDYKGIHSRQPGFSVGFLASGFSNGPHTVHVVVVTTDNRSFEIGQRTINIDNGINQPPFGSVDIPENSGTVDANGSFPVVGWVSDVDGIARVDVLIDNLNHQTAIYGDARPDVAAAFPAFPAVGFSGFVAHIDTTRVTDGIHTLSVRATDRLGLSREIGRRRIQVFNSTNNLRPFGYLDEPLRDAVLYGTNCGVPAPPPVISPVPPPLIPTNHITPIRGWALDLGTREDTGRVSYVELMVDGVQWLSTDQCEFNTAFNALIQCYGTPRYDVAKYYPTYPDSPRSGFMFALDIGSLLNIGVHPGRHIMKVRVGDQEQTFADIPNTSGIPVHFQCAEDTLDFASLGYIDFPVSNDYIGGTVTFAGWAVDENSGGVRNVVMTVDGITLGTAQYAFTRTDVRAVHPTIAGSLNSGWRFTMDTRQLSNAKHRLTALVTDSGGRTTEIGSVDFYVTNPQ